jgi:hypothetical protein
MTGYTVAETRLARVLGAPRKTLRVLREAHLRAEDWRLDGGEVRLTVEGTDRLLEVLEYWKSQPKKDRPTLLAGIARAAAADLAEKDGGPAEPDGSMVLTVESQTRTRHVVMAWVNEPTPQAELVRVQVRDGRNFVEGMRIRARHVDEDLWELVGRAPRSRRDDPMRDEVQDDA